MRSSEPVPDPAPATATGPPARASAPGIHGIPGMAGVVAADVLSIVVFVVLGRRSHHEGSVLAGTFGTAWPFLTGLAAGWAGVLASRARPVGPRAGVLALVGTVAVGMLVRRTIAGGGTPPSFVLVATVFLALFLLGWRLAWTRTAGGRTGTAGVGDRSKARTRRHEGERR